MVRLITIFYRGEECTENASRELIKVLVKEGLCKDGRASVSYIDESDINDETPVIISRQIDDRVQYNVNAILEYFVKMQSYSKYQLLVELIEQTNSFTKHTKLRTAVAVIGNLTYRFVQDHIRSDCGYTEKMHNCVKEVCKTISS